MNRIFISYRREDSAWVSGLIHDRLAAYFGSDAVFTDIDTIPLGVNFKKFIDEQVSKCDIFLAVIGEKWLGVTDDAGQPRLQQPGDFVRLEIESALTRNIPVIPLLVGNVAMPPANKLPKSLRELASRNATQIRPKPTFDSDVGRLIRGIEKHVGIQVKAHEAPATKALETGVGKQALSPGTVFCDRLKDGSEGPEMVIIPPGAFQMGSPEDEEYRNEDEGPRHLVTLTKPFAMGRYPVTAGEYDRYLKATKREWHRIGVLDRDWRDHPASYVSWVEALSYTAWLSGETGKRYRLPTEAEWEYAARAGSETRWSFGDDEGKLAEYAFYRGETRTLKVGKKKPNPWGLYDMYGKGEWMQDCWHESYNGAPSDGSAWEESDCAKRVFRGGRQIGSPGELRSASRRWWSAGKRHLILGFRLAQDL